VFHIASDAHRVAPAFIDVNIHVVDRGATAMTNGVATRFLLIWDAAPNGTAPGMSDMLDGSSAAGVSLGATAKYGSGVNPVNKNRFTVLKEKHLTLPQRTATGNPTPWPTEVFFRMFVKTKGLVTQHAAGATSGIGDLRTGALYLVNISSDDVVTTSYSWSYVARYAFRDI